MKESNIYTFERKKERFPIVREVMEQIELIANGREITTINEPVYDEQGLSEMSMQITDVYGEMIDVLYTRDRLDKNVVVPAIHQTLYSEGIPCGAGTQYVYIEGEWKEIP